MKTEREREKKNELIAREHISSGAYIHYSIEQIVYIQPLPDAV